jgi:hypothetical protein
MDLKSYISETQVVCCTSLLLALLIAISPPNLICVSHAPTGLGPFQLIHPFWIGVEAEAVDLDSEGTLTC